MRVNGQGAEALLAELLIREREYSGTGTAFAVQVLGVSGTCWSRTRNGYLPVGTAVALGAYRAYPELRELANRVLHEELRPQGLRLEKVNG